jgi:signal transduction histidine kinase
VASHARHPVSLPQRSLLIDSAIAVAAFAASLGLLAVGDSVLADDGAGTQALALVFTALATLPLVARRRAPLAVFVATAVAQSALQLIATPAGPPIGPTVALFGLAAMGDGSRARTVKTLTVAFALLLAHAGAVGVADDRFPGTELLFGVLLWGGVWLAGDRARWRLERMSELEDRAARAERDAERDRSLAAAEERTRIARDLHDSAGHAINVILVHAGAGRLQVDRDPAAARAAFGTIEEVARETVGEIDQLVGVLREGNSDHVDPPAGIAALDALIERHRAAGLEVTFSVRGERRPLSPSVDRSAYRILQEALTNAARHGTGSVRVEVHFERSALEIEVVTPVRPGQPAPAAGGHGVVGMRERAALLGGTLDAQAREGEFTVRARLA